MARLEYCIVAQNVSIDQSTNLVSAFGVLEEVRTAGFPLLIPSLAVLSVWHSEQGDQDRDFQCVLRITAPGENPNEFPFNFRLPVVRHRLVHRLQGVPILREGNIRFEILLNGVSQLERVIPVILDASILEGHSPLVSPIQPTH